MHLFSVILFCFVANMDCFMIGISYGLRKVHINLINNITIAFLSCLGTFISMRLGDFLSQQVFIKTANVIGCIILIIIGIMQVEHNRKDDYCSLHISEKNQCRKLSFREVLLVRIALMLNNLSLGIGASITGMPILLSSILTFIMSFSFICLSQLFSAKILSKKFQKYTSIVSGIMIIFIGVWELFI
ncbi:MAG: manganese efflux pump [Coprobacillus sp.]